MSRDFDHNEMQELAALKRWRYERSGGGGTHQVYTTSKAWFDDGSAEGRRCRVGTGSPCLRYICVVPGSLLARRPQALRGTPVQTS